MDFATAKDLMVSLWASAHAGASPRPFGEAVGAQVKDTALGLTDRSVVRKALVLAINLLLVGVLAPIVGRQARGGADDERPQRGKALSDAERCDGVERSALGRQAGCRSSLVRMP